jgi:hypothetical protein
MNLNNRKITLMIFFFISEQQIMKEICNTIVNYSNKMHARITILYYFHSLANMYQTSPFARTQLLYIFIHINDEILNQF